jgi:methylated-DNA-[protein]-cysteine S-methyltransferase
MNWKFLEMESPVGTLRLIADERALKAVLLVDREKPGRVRLPHLEERGDHPVLSEGRSQLEAYFAGRLCRFELPLAAEGTDFQKRVWAGLSRIPFGETRSYGELARELGSPGASRAVGAANGRNPLGIVVPCHRVIGSTGSLTGFAAGIEAKRWLLSHESPQCALKTSRAS